MSGGRRTEVKIGSDSAMPARGVTLIFVDQQQAADPAFSPAQLLGVGSARPREVIRPA